MTPEPTAPAGGADLPPVSDILDPIAALLRLRVLDPSPHPGALAGLGRFEIIGLIGVGGMGVVLLAREPAAPRNVAVKVLKPELAQKPEAVHRFLVEARHMQRLSHPNILKVMEVSDRPEGPYFVMPFMERKSLAWVIRPGEPTDFVLTLRIAREIAGALQYAHGRGLIHRDLKPSNILLDRSGRAHLSDFGLARTMFNDSMVDVRRTYYEGTAPYMPPEGAAGEAGDTRCDIYSLGAVLYEMLTGRPPYSGQTMDQVLRQILAGPPIPISQRNPEAPSTLVKIAEGCMARELRDRYASMADVAADLRQSEAGRVPAGPHGRVQRRTWRLAKAGIIAFLAAAGLICSGLLTWHLLGGQPSPPLSSRTDGQPQAKPSVPGTILADDFNGSRMDDSLWVWSQLSTCSRPGTEVPYFDVSQSGGALVIDCRIRNDAGWGATQDAWADSTVDLKPYREVSIELELSAEAVGGGTMILLAANQKPTQPGDPSSVRLFEASGTKDKPLSIRRQKVRIVLSASSGTARVYSEPADPELFRLLDISSAGAWRLRFCTATVTSTGFPPGAARMSLHRIRASAIEEKASIVGTVLDAHTNRPICAGAVRTAGAATSCPVNRNGHFLLSVDAGDARLVAQVEGYEQVGDNQLVHALPGKIRSINILMKKQRIGFGEVEWQFHSLKTRTSVASLWTGTGSTMRSVPAPDVHFSAWIAVEWQLTASAPSRPPRQDWRITKAPCMLWIGGPAGSIPSPLAIAGSFHLESLAWLGHTVWHLTKELCGISKGAR